jgi:hypothetical protein
VAGVSAAVAGCAGPNRPSAASASARMAKC